MATSKKVTGKVVPYLQLTGLAAAGTGVSAINLGDDAKSINLTDGDGAEAETFYEHSTGFAPLALEVEMVWSPVKTSPYHVLWANSGQKEVSFVYGRAGNSTASADKPILTGKVSLPSKAGWEASAGDDSDSFTVTLQIEGTPTWTYLP